MMRSKSALGISSSAAPYTPALYRIKKLKNLAALNFNRASRARAAAKTLRSSSSAKIEYATGVTTNVSSKQRLWPPMIVTAIAER